MMDLAAAEAAKYAHVWADPRYRNRAWGLELWRERRDLFPDVVKSGLDVGCGHGRLMAAWAAEGIDARAVDIVDGLDPDIRAKHRSRLVVTPLWDLPAREDRADVAVAADVLEHLPTEKVDDCLRAIAGNTKVLIAQTAEYPSEDWEGRPLHLTIEGFDWWAARMRAISGTVERLPHRSKRKIHLLRWTV
jgi:2-polyprenyl-3-methyl-5-hydroxy-6-metoxy-1,4-benzoquinol methylase